MVRDYVGAARGHEGKIMKREPKITTSDLWLAVRQARKDSGLDVPDIRPTGGFTVEEYAKEFACPYPTATRQLGKLAEEGRLVKSFARLRVGGQYRKIAIYAPA